MDVIGLDLQQVPPECLARGCCAPAERWAVLEEAGGAPWGLGACSEHQWMLVRLIERWLLDGIPAAAVVDVGVRLGRRAA